MKNIYQVDLNKDKSKLNPYISETLLTKIDETLKKWEKVLIYLNKRWSYSLLICEDCQNIHKCPRCDIPLTVHSNEWLLVCHHCSYDQKINLECSNCSSTKLKNIWVWTQQIENFLKKKYINNSFFRLDTDTIKSKKDKEEALLNIDKSQIIIGTKMITTGFNFKKLWLIWIILLEQELQIPEYDTEERVYSNIKQLIWRWWRVWQETDIILQTYTPENEIIKDIIYSNYKDFFIKTLKERKLFWYPPFLDYATLRYKNKDKQKAVNYTEKLHEKLLNLDNADNYEIILIKSIIKRNNQFFSKIIIKWPNIREFLEWIKKEIFRERDLAVIFK